MRCCTILFEYHLTVCVPGPGGAGPGQCDGAARGRGSLPLLGLQPAGAARLGEDGRGRGGARVARGGAGQVSSLEAMLHVLHVHCPPVTGCCSPRPGSWASWCGWRSACTGGTTASTSPPATDPPARRTTHPGQSASLLFILYLHTVSIVYTISTHRVYFLYYIYTPCLPSIPYLHTVCTYLIYISTPSTVLAISMDTDHVPTFITVNVPTSCSCFVNDFVFY